MFSRMCRRTNQSWFILVVAAQRAGNGIADLPLDENEAKVILDHYDQDKSSHLNETEQESLFGDIDEDSKQSLFWLYPLCCLPHSAAAQCVTFLPITLSFICRNISLEHIYGSFSWKLDQGGCRFPDEIKIKTWNFLNYRCISDVSWHGGTCPNRCVWFTCILWCTILSHWLNQHKLVVVWRHFRPVADKWSTSIQHSYLC